MYRFVVLGRPVTKSNFKLLSKNGRAIVPRTGKYAKYALYEDDVKQAVWDTFGYPPPVIIERCIAVLTFVYPNNVHPDLTNAPKSLCDGLEKSGLIVNDKQIGPEVVLRERIDKEQPRAEIELYPVSQYELQFAIIPKSKE